MLLAKGKVIYFSDKDKAVPYFASIGYQCPSLTNPSDYFMSMMSVESLDKEDIDAKNVEAVESSSILIAN
jgi:ATP-binding cassette subfamily G (WHITE) protein 1